MTANHSPEKSIQMQNHTLRYFDLICLCKKCIGIFRSSIEFKWQLAIVNTDCNAGEEQNRIQRIEPEDDGRCAIAQFNIKVYITRN